MSWDDIAARLNKAADRAAAGLTKAADWAADNASELGHGALDVAGFVPLIGEGADVVNAIWYAGEGDYLSAGLSLLSMIPVVGDVIGKGGKYAAKLSPEAAKKVLQLLQKIDISSFLAKFKGNPKLDPHLDKIAGALKKWQDDLEKRFGDQPAGKAIQPCPKAEVWKEGAVVRGRKIEDDVAKTDYKDWLQTDDIAGYEKARNFPLIDFVKGNEVVNLKTLDTSSKSWLSRMRNQVDKMNEGMPQVIDKLKQKGVTLDNPTKVLDIRVKPGQSGDLGLELLRKYGAENGVKVRISEYP